MQATITTKAISDENQVFLDIHWGERQIAFFNKAIQPAIEGTNLKTIDATIKHNWRYPDLITLRIEADYTEPAHTIAGKLADYYAQHANDEGALSQDIDFTDSSIKVETEYDDEDEPNHFFNITIELGFDS